MALKAILHESRRCSTAFYSLLEGRLDPVILNFTSLREAYSEASLT